MDCIAALVLWIIQSNIRDLLSNDMLLYSLSVKLNIISLHDWITISAIGLSKILYWLPRILNTNFTKYSN